MREVYRRFADAATSPLHAHLARAVSGSDAALRALDAVPARSRRPALVLAALHDLALAGRAQALAAAYDAGDGDAAAGAAVDVLVRTTGAAVAAAAHRRIRSDDVGRCAVLHPVVAEAAWRAAADAVGLVDVGCAAGFGLRVDRVAIGYGDGPWLGEPASPVRLRVRVVGDRPVPHRAVPEVVARVGVDPDPLDVTDPHDTRWLRACLPPDDREARAHLDAAIALTAGAPPLLLRGNPVDLLPEALARVPAGALPVVTTTWALSRLPPEGRRRFVHRLEEAAGRAVAWVSAEGVGVAPGIPTLGDRPASGHSILGLALLDGATRQAEALGRCWSRGRLLSWPAGG
ncbi:DUF2332 domain-containing protein [Blastococcus sp. SYSU DS0510]